MQHFLPFSTLRREDRFPFGVGGVFVLIMNGLISRRRRLHNPEIDRCHHHRSTVAPWQQERALWSLSCRSRSVGRSAWRRSFVNSSSGSMITGWTDGLHSGRASDCDNGWGGRRRCQYSRCFSPSPLPMVQLTFPHMSWSRTASRNK